MPSAIAVTVGSAADPPQAGEPRRLQQGRASGLCAFCALLRPWIRLAAKKLKTRRGRVWTGNLGPSKSEANPPQAGKQPRLHQAAGFIRVPSCPFVVVPGRVV